MRRFLVAVAASLALTASLGFGASAQATCSVTCLNHRVKQLAGGLIKAEKKIASLNQTVSQQTQTIAAQGAAIASMTKAAKFTTALEECLFEVPLNQYGEPGAEEGYLYETQTPSPEVFKTTALDVVEKGQAVGAWFLIDGCNPFETASIKAVARSFFP